jgi:adenosylcobinamide-GDP ribazoletransferase
MKKELHIFLTAVMFYTRIPCPTWVDHSEDLLNKATKYFPFMGWIVGGAAALVFFGFVQILPSSVSVLLSTAFGVWMTGAFHEDGFADVCDGFGGGWTQEKILSIMKDSRVGAYGAIGIGLLMALKIIALAELAQINWLSTIYAIISAHALSRLTATTIILTDEYARENEDSKAKPVAKKMSLNAFLQAAIWGIGPLSIWCFFGQNFLLLVVFIPLILLKIYLSGYFKKWINGYTGDCLGATQQLAEVICYLTFLAILK